MEDKMAAFHSMLHLVCNLSFSKEDFEKEVVYMKVTASQNIFSNVTSRNSPHCHPSAQRLQLRGYNVSPGYLKKDFQHHGKARHPDGS
jgi:hypothetical protein